jgi:hypothetical protein
LKKVFQIELLLTILNRAPAPNEELGKSLRDAIKSGAEVIVVVLSAMDEEAVVSIKVEK